MSEVKTYQQADEPTDATPGTGWLRADGSKAQRDMSGAWVEKGSWTLENDGMLPKAGGAVTGAVIGNHGHAPMDSPAFTTNATLDGDDLATKVWVAQQIADLMTTIQDYISNAISGGESSITIGQNFVLAYGTVANGGTVPLPTYSSGVKAVKSEITLLIPFLLDSNFRYRDQHHCRITVGIDPDTLIATVTYDNGHREAGDIAFTVTIGYAIACMKS